MSKFRESVYQKKLKKIYYQNTQNLKKWANNRVFGLFIFNIIVMLLILLYTAGYFAPFFPLTINFIVLVSLILSIILLGVKSKALLVIALLFWIFAAVIRILKIEVWAERTAIYSYQALFIGILLLIIEIRNKKV